MSDERPTKESPPAAFCSESVATIDTVKRPYCPGNPCAFFAALQGKRCAMVNDTGGGNGMWRQQSIAFPRDSQARTFAELITHRTGDSRVPHSARFWAGRGVARLFPLSCKKASKASECPPIGPLCPPRRPAAIA